ncbi:thiazole biosynthesis adenylyltransferase ThiF [Metabacillus fastidiosus]|uniref:Thiazole biosynthesis adenylyltransferase ThiF n=1 Tax=Metabacillus fastidiosus TaxID=1458 RepID=A0ABU6P2S4_9BACI|nr:thiazole biosynthesis adenylyltransferase ThiF [Metabacillus fastidiosus]MED4403218.1 thiazole biosynthesis adenylyltransferase ThiF [Metabacillus fastidiosus]MED4455453.1 thiazole biosynthesis adenylyltransferase ThiF [Metabacillus fastidiosus]MED4461642.1 thiazole biosynthesis adenylyltransferase ThiF [Metabacillus fastidiosus]
MERYSRQILFSPVGEAGQEKIRGKHALLVGAGALGTANAEILVRAGIGEITIIDRDYVEWSNLQRQQLYTENDAEERLPKAIAAKNHLSQINSEVKINVYVDDVSSKNIEDWLTGVNVILDCTDNFETRLLINDASLKYNIPWIYGGVVGSYGLSFTIIPHETPCLHCLLKHIPFDGMTCDTVGVISPAVTTVVAHQATEALKILVEDKENIRKKLVSFDLWKNQYSSINMERLKNDACPTCGENPVYPYLTADKEAKVAVLCGRDTVQIRPPEGSEKKFDFVTIAKRVKPIADTFLENGFLLSFSVDKHRLVLFQDGRALIHGTKDVAEAKTIYHRYIG